MSAFMAMVACAGACDPGDRPEPTDDVEGTIAGAELDVAARGGGLTPVRVDRPVAVAVRPAAAGDDGIAAAVREQAGSAGVRLGAADTLVARAAVDDGAVRHVRLDQFHRGVRVRGAEVVAHVRGDALELVAGNLLPELDIDVSPTLTAEGAREAAAAHHAGAEGIGAGFSRTKESAELVVMPKGERVHLAWHVRFSTGAGADGLPGRWNVLVDAHDGAVLQRWNNVHTTAQASGPGGTPKFPWAWTEALDVEPQGETYAMDTAELVTYDISTGEDVVVTGPLVNIGDEESNNAHGYSEVTLDMLQEWFGRDSIDDAGYRIVSHVHYEWIPGVPLGNAFWDGAEMYYGDGDDWFYPLSGALDVVAHEINHGFTQFHSNLEYVGQSGGMNESFSDIAGTVAEFFLLGEDGDFEIGEDIWRLGDGALRSMCDPTSDGWSIDHIDDFEESIDVHLSSGIMNKAFCRAARRMSSGDPEGAATVAGVKRTAEAFYAANASYWTSLSTFAQGCRGVLDAAIGLGFTETEVAALQDSWADVGLSCGPSLLQ